MGQCLEAVGLKKRHSWGKGSHLGQKLGSDSPSPTHPDSDDDKRNQRLKAIEARQGGKGSAKPRKRPKQPKVEKEKEAKVAEPVIREPPVNPTTSESGATKAVSDEQRMRLAAAEKRKEANLTMNGLISKDKAKELDLRKRKDELVGRIQQIYSDKGKDVPLNIRSRSLQELSAMLREARSK